MIRIYCDNQYCYLVAVHASQAAAVPFFASTQHFLGVVDCLAASGTFGISSEFSCHSLIVSWYLAYYEIIIGLPHKDFFGSSLALLEALIDLASLALPALASNTTLVA